MMIADTHADVNTAPPLNEIPDLIQRILEAEKSKKEKRDKTRKMAMYHEVSISALAEAGRQETSVEVPFQRKYSSRKPVVPSSLANTPCVDLGIDELLSHLNTLLGTSHKPTMYSLSSLLQSCISANYDFGTAYSRLRPEWFSDFETVKDTQRKLEAEDLKTREQVLVDNQIRVAMPPRRVWDLYSNRVVPYCLILEEPWAVLHDWVDDLVSVTTPINGGEWPVPVPADANLDLIRIELLNLGAEYVWLDALCLRQKGGKREDLRETEWMTDMPTIGNVYRWSEVVVHYLNGLGRVSGRTYLRRRHLDICDRSWFHCAWKEPEVNNHEIVAGYVPSDTEETVHPQGEAASSQKQFAEDGQLDVKQIGKESICGAHRLFGILSDMKNRASTNPVDKVAGLAYFVQSHMIPTYYELKPPEEAWTALVNVMNGKHRGQLLFRYPDVGRGASKWRPTWDEVMRMDLPTDADCTGFVHYDDRGKIDLYVGPCIKRGVVRGLAVESMEGAYRTGTLIVEDAYGTKHEFKILASHKTLIPEGIYMLLGSEAESPDSPQCWVVGRQLHQPEDGFEKLSVLEMTDYEEVKRLKELGVAVKSRHVLV